jgi:hypothetical protein
MVCGSFFVTGRQRENTGNTYHTRFTACETALYQRTDAGPTGKMPTSKRKEQQGSLSQKGW